MWKYILMTFFLSLNYGWTQTDELNEEMEEYSNSEFMEEGRDLDENLEEIQEKEFEEILYNDLPIIPPEENTEDDKDELNPYE